MCGRYSLTAPDPAHLRARFGLAAAVEIIPRYNVAPGDAILSVTTDRAGVPRTERVRWGLVPPFVTRPASSGTMINARAETVADKPAVRASFSRFRCLIPADGFYEWARRPGEPRTAFHITRADAQPFAFAGLWSVWHRGQEDELRSAAIITTAANAAIAPLHDRMPVILDSETEATWLDPGTPAPALGDLLEGLDAEQLTLRPVGPAVNDARHDAPDCLADPPTDAGPLQPALF